MSVTVGDMRPSYSTLMVQNRSLITEDNEPSGRPIHVTVQENANTIQSIILDGRRISIKKNSRDPVCIPRKSRLCWSRSFTPEKALSQMDSQVSECSSEAWTSACFTSHFGPTSVESCGISERFPNYGWNMDQCLVWSRTQITIRGTETVVPYVKRSSRGHQERCWRLSSGIKMEFDL
jgi:hypothetical protein